ncbi:MAG: dienelactone hydrolase family protein [Alphaproteobacteria bacterium]|nr:dienelactone hydrolase family protein [Alphaproteobacteria bacterium]
MCDDHTEADNAARNGNLSRRGFATLAGSAALAACASGQTADGETLVVSERDVTITTADGACDAHFVHPSRGKHPGVIVWPDIRGLRPAFRQMGKRLAESGYAVLTVNQFYRNQKAPVVQPGESFSDPAVRARLWPMAQALNATTAAMDATAVVTFLDGQSSVDTSKKIGTTGYCMGGPLVMATAATLPARIGAGASFHGGGLATAAPTSPHLRIPQMKASFLIAVAQNDDARTPQEKETLRTTFAANGLDAEIEVYPADHGWCPPDSPVYNEAQAEKAWARLLALFGKAL